MITDILRKRFLWIVFFPLSVLAQANGPYAGEIRKASAVIKGAQNMAYNYSLLSEYPNGETDHLTGEVYINQQKKLMFNQNNVFSMLYTDKWYYKADHKKKTVTIVNLEKHLHKDYKSGIEQDVFENNSAAIYCDSMLLKYGSVNRLSKSNDSVQMELTFPQNSPVKRISISYTDKSKMLTAYSMQTWQPWPGSDFGKNKGTKQIIACTNYRKIGDDKDYTTDKFFVIRKNKVSLRKYKNYKVFTRI